MPEQNRTEFTPNLGQPVVAHPAPQLDLDQESAALRTFVDWMALAVVSLQGMVLLTLGVQLFQALHWLPLVPEALQLLGAGVSARWVYRWLLLAENRGKLRARIDALLGHSTLEPLALPQGIPLELPLRLSDEGPAEVLVEVAPEPLTLGTETMEVVPPDYPS